MEEPQWLNGQKKGGPALIDQAIKSGGGRFVPSNLQVSVNVELQ